MLSLANNAYRLWCVLCRVFDHWEVITQDPMKPDSPSNIIMLDVRKRKGLKEQPNAITEYEDKL
jgi:elongation factor 2